MQADRTIATAAELERELAWLEQVLQARISLHFGQSTNAEPLHPRTAPALPADPAAPGDYAALVHEAGLGVDERLVLALALAPHLRPQLLDLLCVRNPNLERGFSEFGGCKGRAHAGFLPTAETAAFMLAGEALAGRFAVQRLLDDEQPLRRHGLLQLQHEAPGEPWLSAALQVGAEVPQRLATGATRKPDYGAGFPARR